MQAFDLVLTDASGRSVRAHRALLMDKSDYFARILDDHSLRELQLNENYLIELIHYLYSHDSDYGRPPETASLAISPDILYQPSHDDRYTMSSSDDNTVAQSNTAPMANGEIEILMRLLILSRKYGFRQLYRNLVNEINFKMGPSTVITIYTSACELGLQEFLDSTKLMILSWLPQLQTSAEYLSLPELAIRDIFSAEEPEIETESKLNALSAWWSHNEEAKMTDLWVKIMMSS